MKISNRWQALLVMFLIALVSTIVEKLGLDPWANGYLSGAAVCGWGFYVTGNKDK